ncbi:hypothetical protein LRAMOSA03578 [Lichtheimia ramosa]|uniref:NAD+ kinase n=1 Tax=Lichtheimia ramosa TaxID=688394 RepID=A0A077WVJ0_9FUNG|nr:hypothetical protein LRAMOSA03578 [Lichtheimia ramosa]
MSAADTHQLKLSTALLSQSDPPMVFNDNNSTCDPCKTAHSTNASERLSDTAGVVREVTKKLGKTRIKWDNPEAVMVITKPGDVSLVGMTREVVLWLIRTKDLTVYVDAKLKTTKRFRYKRIIERFPAYENKLKFWDPDLCASQPKLFHFIITLGGDGTVLFTSWLFQSYVPPVIPFNLGSLGFLTPFQFDRFEQHLTQAMERGVRINMRGRLTCTVYRRVPYPENSTQSIKTSVQLRNVKRNPVTGEIKVGGWCKATRNKKYKKFGEVDGEDVEEDEDGQPDDVEDMMEHRQIPCFTTVPVEKYHVINDLVVDRGPSPYVSLLELFGDDKHLTTVQADGLAISTPTGSTAYSLSAGGPLTHPEIHAILITPICAHTLSFRPTLVPDSMELRICVPYNSRNTAWASFDGRGRVELKQGDHIKVTASKYPFPTVCKEDQATDWFKSLSNCLNWNIRQRQKSFAVVESNRTSNGRRSGSSTPSSAVSRVTSSTAISRMSPINNNNNNPTSPTSITNNQQQQQHLSRKASVKSSNGSSPESNVCEEIFGMFIDDDEYLQNKSGSASGSLHGIETASLEEEDTFTDDSDEEEDPNERFHGWTDEEILRARFNASLRRTTSFPATSIATAQS